MSSKKLGRPIVGSLKNIDIKVRIDEEMNQNYLNIARKTMLKELKQLELLFKN